MVHLRPDGEGGYMGRVTVEEVIGVLKAAGLRAGAAYPGERMPQLEDIAAAVSLERVDSGEKTLTVLVRIYCPTAMGGNACREAALAAGTALESMGADWKLSECQPQAMGTWLMAQVKGVFSGEAAGWTPETEQAGFSVKLGSIPLKHVMSFTAEQVLDTKQSSTLNAMIWEFQIREHFPVGCVEEGSPNEPFTLTLTRGSFTETFQSCTWTARRRVDEADGMEQIRTGTAKARGVMGVI